MHDQMVNKLSVKEYGDPFSNVTKGKRENKIQENKAVKKVKKEYLWGVASVKSGSLNEVKAIAFRREQVLQAYSRSSNHAF